MLPNALHANHVCRLIGESHLIGAGRKCYAGADEGCRCNQEEGVRCPLHDGFSNIGSTEINPGESLDVHMIVDFVMRQSNHGDGD